MLSAVDAAHLQPNMPGPATLLISVCPPADRPAREHGPVHGWRWRTPDRRWSISSKRSDNCGKNSSLRDYERGRSVLQSSLGRHICLLRREPEQRRGRTCVRESYCKDCSQRASNLKPRSARSAPARRAGPMARLPFSQSGVLTAVARPRGSGPQCDLSGGAVLDRRERAVHIRGFARVRTRLGSRM
jgi:hypothetical protein